MKSTEDDVRTTERSSCFCNASFTDWAEYCVRADLVHVVQFIPVLCNMIAACRVDKSFFFFHMAYSLLATVQQGVFECSHTVNMFQITVKNQSKLNVFTLIPLFGPFVYLWWDNWSLILSYPTSKTLNSKLEGFYFFFIIFFNLDFPKTWGICSWS